MKSDKLSQVMSLESVSSGSEGYKFENEIKFYCGDTREVNTSVASSSFDLWGNSGHTDDNVAAMQGTGGTWSSVSCLETIWGHRRN